MTWGSQKQPAIPSSTTRSPFDRAGYSGYSGYSGGYGNNGGYAGAGYSAGYSSYYGGGGGTSNSNAASNTQGSSWLSNSGGGGYYASEWTGYKDYSAALSALTLLGFLYFLNMLQNQLLSTGSQTVVFTVGGGTGTGGGTGNGTFGRVRREAQGEEMWGQDFPMEPQGNFQQQIGETFWFSDEESEFEMGFDSGAGKPEAAQRRPRPWVPTPSSSSFTTTQNTEDDLVVEDEEVSTPGYVTRPMDPLIDPDEAWRELSFKLPGRLAEAFMNCREVVACVVHSAHGETEREDSREWETECLGVIEQHDEECGSLANTLKKVLASTRTVVKA